MTWFLTPMNKYKGGGPILRGRQADSNNQPLDYKQTGGRAPIPYWICERIIKDEDILDVLLKGINEYQYHASI